MSIPVPLTPLLGRERELQETQRLLAATRLLTITGAGGSGKTRLALALAHLVAPGFDSVYWVDLAPIADPELIAQQIAAALQAHEPAHEHGDAITEFLSRPVSTLLVLDNCEHLVSACASIAETLLRSAPQVKIVVTTREALSIAGEQIWVVPPMCESGALELFAERARAVLPSFQLDSSNRETALQICTRLDRIPLAIELAAARVKVLPVEQIAARLDDTSCLLSSGSRTIRRHRTIRETIDWSYQLLTPEEQTLLRRLSVFAGSFSLEAAESICGDDGVYVLSLLSALVDKSLIMAADGRYRLLLVVRQFAAEKLAVAGERHRLREIHGRWFCEHVQRLERKIFFGAVDVAKRIDTEIDDIRAVLDWAAEDPSRAEIELRLLWALHFYWYSRGHFSEARRRLTAGLTRAADVDPVVRARAIVAAGNAAVWQADFAALRPSVDEAVAILRQSNNLRALANGLVLLGIAHACGDRDHAAAMATFAEAEEIARRNGRNIGLAFTLAWSAIAALLRGDLAAARRACEETHAIGVETNNLPATGHGAAMLAYVALQQNKPVEAMRLLDESLQVHAESADRWGATLAVETVALALLRLRDTEDGTRLCAAASAAWLRLRARPARRELFEREKDQWLRHALSDERLRPLLASGAAMSQEQMVELAHEKVREFLRNRDAVPAQAVAGTPRLRIRALGAVEISGDAAALNQGRHSARAKELLLYLLCHPSGATKEQIGVALWPDADADRLRNNFHVTVHRLRKALGRSEWVRAYGEMYSLDCAAAIDFDAAAFEKAAKAALRDNDVKLLQEAAALYRGDFLQNVSAGDWHVPIRERLRDLYAEVLRALGRAQMSAADFRSAAATYEKLTALDDLDEQAYRNLLTCRAREGDIAGATLAYRRLASALRRELGTEPDPATTRLHARIVTEASHVQ